MDKMKSLDYFFKPQGCAIYGASNDPLKAGGQIVANMLDAGYSGKIIPINPKETVIRGLKAYSSIMNIEEQIELVIISTPAHATEEIVKDLELRSKRIGDIKAVITAAAGFGETHEPVGIKRQKILMDYCKKYNIREMGPNCVGVIDNVNKLDTTFILGTKRREGGVSFISQSGALGAWLVSTWSSQPLPISLNKFISLGNMADVDLIETLEYLEQDEKTTVIGLYIEGHSAGKRLVETMGRISKKKPLVVLKVGRSEHGSEAAHSHTGSMVGSDDIYEGAFKQFGVVRVETVEELSDTLQAFDKIPLPPGKNTFLVTQAGGPGIYCVDAIARSKQIEFAMISQETKDKLTQLLPAFASVCKPEGHTDITAAANIKQHCQAVETLMMDDAVDNIVFITVPTLFLSPDLLGQELIETFCRLKDKGTFKAFFPVLLSGNVVREGRKILESSDYLTFETPDRAVKSLNNMLTYLHFRGDGGVEQ